MTRQMIPQKYALIVSNMTALNNFQSGATLRVSTIELIIRNLGFKVRLVSVEEFKKTQLNYFDLIVLTPFSSSKVAFKARGMTHVLWYDACDSWLITRITRLKRGEPKQLLAIFQDLFFSIFHPRFDFKTFISYADAQYGRISLRARRQKTFVVPNQYDEHQVNESDAWRVVFVGDGDYRPNQAAISFLERASKFLPKDLEIYVVGKGFNNAASSLIFQGYLEESKLYNSRDIHVAPIFSGAGIKNKVAIPLTLGLEVVTTKHGARGLERVKNLHLAESPLEFAKAIISITTSHHHGSTCSRIFSHNDTPELIRDLKKKIGH